MGCHRFATKITGDLFVGVERDVDAEIDREERASGAHVLLRWIALKFSPGAAWISDYSRAVVLHDRIDTCETRHHSFVTAGKSGDEVRLNESENNPTICLDIISCKMDRVTFIRMSTERVSRPIVSIVIYHSVASRDIGPKHVI